MTTLYMVETSIFLDAESPEDAVRQAAAWLADDAHGASYRVEWVDEDSQQMRAKSVDAETLAPAKPVRRRR